MPMPPFATRIVVYGWTLIKTSHPKSQATELATETQRHREKSCFETLCSRCLCGKYSPAVIRLLNTRVASHTLIPWAKPKYQPQAKVISEKPWSTEFHAPWALS